MATIIHIIVIFKAFSCSKNSKFRLASKHCEGKRIFPPSIIKDTQRTVEWKPVTHCISKPCMIPAKGIRIVSRTCKEDPFNAKTIINQIFTKKTHKNCSRTDRYVQICSNPNDLDGCSKLITPSQFASNKCSMYQVITCIITFI